MSTQELISLGGMLGPILYTTAWVLGGILQPEYSHIRDDISSLMAVGAPNKKLFDLMNIINNALMIIFFGSLHWFINDGQGSYIGPICFMFSNSIGLAVVLFFPLDEGGEPVTPRGKMHVTLVGMMSVFALVGMIALWRRLIFTPGWVRFGNYTLISLIVTIITAVIAAKNIGTDRMGITERFVVTANLQYFFAIALNVYLTA
ncbi:MAG: DUF998 domain-containing protein [Candidatus Bathyarchaeota archaeon]